MLAWTRCRRYLRRIDQTSYHPRSSSWTLKTNLSLWGRFHREICRPPATTTPWRTPPQTSHTKFKPIAPCGAPEHLPDSWRTWITLCFHFIWKRSTTRGQMASAPCPRSKISKLMEGLYRRRCPHPGPALTLTLIRRSPTITCRRWCWNLTRPALIQAHNTSKPLSSGSKSSTLGQSLPA